MKRLIVGIGVLVLVGYSVLQGVKRGETDVPADTAFIADQSENLGGPVITPHPLSIEAMRNGEYPGSDLVIEQTLTAGSNYERFIASYKSDGLRVFGLLTVPSGQPSQEEGFPAIIFNHGYISPSVYRTTERYVAYQDAFATAGYVTFKSDYRGHGSSEGKARGGYGNTDYLVDVLNALSSVRRLESVDPARIGMWGHSMGGHITLNAMVLKKDIKASVIWAGVVGSYEDLFTIWHSTRRSERPSPTLGGRRRWRTEMIEEYGSFSENPDFWNSLSATNYLNDISGPVQLHHGTADTSVEIELSELLEKRLKDAGKDVEFYSYPGDDHNISANLSLALSRSVAFFDRYLK